MDSASLTRVLTWSGTDPSQDIIAILQNCDVTTYAAFCNLRHWNFVQSCLDYQLRINANFNISPGRLTILQSVGTFLCGKTEFEFQTVVDMTPEAKPNYPLLDALNQQLYRRSYPDILKDFSLLVRLKGGRKLHQLLSDNLPIPSTASTDKFLANMDFSTEGEVQVSSGN